MSLDLPDGWRSDGDLLTVAPDVTPTDTYRATYDPRTPVPPRLLVHIATEQDVVAVPVALRPEPVVLPPARASLRPDTVVINTTAEIRNLDIDVHDVAPRGSKVTMIGPDGWQVHRTDTGFAVKLPRDVAAGRYCLDAKVNGNTAVAVRLSQHDHVAPTANARPAQVSVSVIEAVVPKTRVGYIGGGNDRVGHWLSAMGAVVTDLSAADLTQEAALDDFDTIVIGIFAMRFRPGLAAAMPALHRWTAAGGTLVTLYHRPWDAWSPETTPPKRIEIGQPSLRWRVTNENATVSVLTDHPILTTPNRIGAEDWAGWVKERGLYFAKSWDQAYTPLLSMSDPNEAPLLGALLVADIGAGRHIHSSLILHHQMANGVPGAFRLMANFISKR